MPITSPTIQKLHSETAKISWHDLQPHFARGSLMVLDPALDLVQIAFDFAQDQTDRLKSLIHSKQIGPPDDNQAKCWYLSNAEFWAVVVSPFVLIQPVR
jgi:hypothetical protein